MDPNAFLASLQQNGTQFTPAQLQQIQLFQQQQQQNQQQQVAAQNVDTLNTNNEQSVQNISNITNNNSTQNNPTSDMNGATTFQVPTQAGTHQVTNAPPVPVNSTTNSYATNNAFQMALLGATPLQQQLAALSGYSQPQPNTTQASNDNNTMQKQQGTGTDNGQAQQQQQQIQSWNPQMLQQQFNGVNPFMATQGLVVPTAMNVQQLQQQFLTQQFLTQQLAAAGHNPTTSGNFNILASLLAQSGAASAMNPAAAGIPNQMFQPPAMSGFPFVTAPVPPQQHLMTTTTNNQVNHINVKGSNDGMKVGGEVEWTKPFAAKVKKESPFPLKLYQILGNPECQECITWNPHGRSWRILKPPVFEQVVIPLYFRHAKYASFMRQVNGWGFKRVVTGSDHNSYYHELFVRDNPQLCLQMKRIKRNDADDNKQSKDDDGHDEDEVNQDDKAPSNGDNNAGAMTMTVAQSSVPVLPTPTPEDLLKFAGMAGMLPVGLNAGAMVGQPNFMLNNMLPAAALLGNPSAAMMNGMNPLNFVAGLPNTNATPQAVPQQSNQQQFQPAQQQQSQSSAPTVAMSNITTGTSQQTTSAGNNGNLMGAFAGVDSATLAKIQEIVANGGAETLLQQLQQHGQQQLNGGFGTMNNTTSIIDGTGGVTMNTISNNNESDTPNQGEITIKQEIDDPVEHDDEDDDDDDDEDDDEDDDDEDDDIAGV